MKSTQTTKNGRETTFLGRFALPYCGLAEIQLLSFNGILDVYMARRDYKRSNAFPLAYFHYAIIFIDRAGKLMRVRVLDGYRSFLLLQFLIRNIRRLTVDIRVHRG